MEIGVRSGGESQCKKPRGWLGRWVLRNMNSRHSEVTDWGLAHISIGQNYTILDVGCGGGRTLSKLAEQTQQGKVYGIDYSEESVSASKRTNARWIAMGRVEIVHGSVSHLPFSDGMFDLVTAVETHFWWPQPAYRHARNLPSPEARRQAHHHRRSVQGSEHEHGTAMREIRLADGHDTFGRR